MKQTIRVDNQNNNYGIGFLGVLTIAFIVLKLTGVIEWSWLWVLAPIWIPWALFIIIFAIIFVVLVIKVVWKGN